MKLSGMLDTPTVWYSLDGLSDKSPVRPLATMKVLCNAPRKKWKNW